jgi:hypothetical protein
MSNSKAITVRTLVVVVTFAVSQFAMSCVRPAPNTVEEYAAEFDMLHMGMSPAEVRKIFPKVHKASEHQAGESLVAEYRFQDGTAPRPGSPMGNFDRIPHYMWFYFIDSRLVEWSESRIDYKNSPSIIVEWRNR